MSSDVHSSTEKNFDALLCWLDPDRDRAGIKYEEIRHSLIRIFEWRHCDDPEGLADETITRVIQKFNLLQGSYAGEPARYFYAVARNVVHESRRRAARELAIGDARESSPSPDHDDSLDEELEALDEWLNTLTAPDRKLLLDYYADEGIAKIQSRKKLAETLGLSSATLRKRVHRLRMDGEKWIRKRLAKRKAFKWEE